MDMNNRLSRDWFIGRDKRRWEVELTGGACGEAFDNFFPRVVTSFSPPTQMEIMDECLQPVLDKLWRASTGIGELKGTRDEED
jgi:hypothetical protein